MIDATGNWDARSAPGGTDGDGIELRADVTERDDGPDECTIWPHDASGRDLLTRWVAAEEGSFVSLTEMR